MTLVPTGTTGNGGLRVSASDQDGRFHIADVIPDRYRILAWDTMDSDMLSDEGLLLQFAHDAPLIDLESGESVDVSTLRLTSIAAVIRALGN